MNLDAKLHNADWTKQTWDLDTSNLIRWIRTATKQQVRAFARRPAFQAAPGSVRTAVEARLRA